MTLLLATITAGGIILALGNGVVLQQAATAIRHMIEQQKTLEEE